MDVLSSWVKSHEVQLSSCKQKEEEAMSDGFPSPALLLFRSLAFGCQLCHVFKVGNIGNSEGNRVPEPCETSTSGYANTCETEGWRHASNLDAEL